MVPSGRDISLFALVGQSGQVGHSREVSVNQESWGPERGRGRSSEVGLAPVALKELRHHF